MAETIVPRSLACFHCGSDIGNSPILFGEHVFCCDGCKTVYQVLESNGLCEYYSIDISAGESQKKQKESFWTVDELNLMVKDFLLNQEKTRDTVLLHIPQMHCSSCIWLLEKLGDIDNGIQFSRADFIKKTIQITYDSAITTFGNIVLLLRKLGYEPSLLPENSGEKSNRENRKILLKLGVAGFCAGNIMMFSFPAYLGLSSADANGFYRLFGAMNVLLSIPLVLYSGSEYLQALVHWFRFRTITVKVPLAIGISVLWLRSIYEVASAAGPGYFDSLAGLIFFLLTGTWLQNRVFDSIRFGEKTVRFFPLVARTVVKGEIVPKRVTDLLPGDRLRIRNGEIIPADGILLFSDALVQYAFATGESTPQEKVAGELLLGGGKNCGDGFEMEVVKPFNNSRLSDLWNHSNTEKNGDSTLKYEKIISTYFIAGTILVALAALIYWLPINQSKAWFAFTAVLMVACPCALALAPPFTFNTLAAFFAKNGLYLKKPEVVGMLGETKTVVFDKTGTLTKPDLVSAQIPAGYSKEELQLLKSIAEQSNHPYSAAIFSTLNEIAVAPVSEFISKPGYGTKCNCNGLTLKLGSYKWVSNHPAPQPVDTSKQIWFSINARVMEPITVSDTFRENIAETLNQLKSQNLELYLASGDETASDQRVKSLFGSIFNETLYNLSPFDKSALINSLQSKGRVLMVGDGLNDADALKAGDAGMVVTENTMDFFPEATSIILHKDLFRLPGFMKLAKKGNRIVKEAFVVSLIYNLTALSLAFTGKMSPVIAAILMPSSAIALMLFAWLRTKYLIFKEAQK